MTENERSRSAAPGADGSDGGDDRAPRAQDRRVVFLLDVDNTLLDNDAAKAELDRRLRELVGEAETGRFWDLYEEVRHDTGVVSYPLTLARYDEDLRLRGQPTEAARAIEERRRALADLVMLFPYDQYLFPGTRETIAHLRRLGRVAILSDGDPAYQPIKIARSGLAAAVDGYVLVYAHKEEHTREILAAFPADHYVLVEDKPMVIAKMRARLPAPLTTVLVKQGKYAAAAATMSWAGADLTVEAIGDLRDLSFETFLGPGRAPAARA